MHQQQLPVRAAIEGPAACFRLLEIDDGSGMKHDQFVALLMTATDNRMKLEDIHEAWGKHATTTSSDENNDNNINNNGGPFDDRIGRGGAATDTNNNSSCILLLPPFLRAFTALARIKYYGDDSPQEESDHGGSVNRLLLRDVFDNITKPTPVTARYGICAHLVCEGVCSFLLSQRSFTIYLFETYGEASTSPRCQDSAADAQGCIRPSPSPGQGNREETAVTENHRMNWGGFLAIASDLQLIPRLMGLDSLRATVEQASVAPHRVERGNELGSPLGGSFPNPNARTKRAVAGMSYPQFVEVLSLLATSAADRLRLLYPDVTGPDPSLAVEGSRTDEKLTDSSADTGTSRGGRLLSESKSAEVEHGGVGRGGKTKSRNNAGGQLIHRKEIDVRVSMRLKSGRSRGAAAAPTAEAATEEKAPFYDVGVLKALFHHAQEALEEKHPATASGRTHSRANLPRSFISPPPCRGTGGGDALPSAPLEDCSSEQSSQLIGGDGGDELDSHGSDDDEGLRNREGDGMVSTLGYEGAAEVVGSKMGPLQGASSCLGAAARVLEEIACRVADLEVEILPRETSQRGALSAGGTAGVEGLPLPQSFAPEAGGAFARLVVVKELQPVPEHAPDDARHLLELTLDHHQAGRYALALETLEKGVTMWGELLGVDEEGEQGTTDSVGGLEASDEALALLFEASIYQSAGSDTDALSTLLRVDEAIDAIHQDDFFLREALLATVLSEMGVTLYYASQTALSLRCFRLALVVRHELLRSGDQRVFKTTEGGEPVGIEKSDGGWKGAPGYGERDSDSLAADAGKTVAAIALNNFAVCLAGIGETSAAAQALVISSTITTSALGVEHPRSAILLRNLAIVKATKGRVSRSSSRDGGNSVGKDLQKLASPWEEEILRILGSKRVEDLLVVHNAVAQPTSRVIPGGFFFAGKLPPPADGGKVGGSKGKGKKKGGKKRGKSARRR